MTPPVTTHRQQQALNRLTNGRADSTPATSPPMTAGWSRLVVVLPSKVSDELLTFQVAERVLQFHQLDEEIVLRIEPRRVHRALEVERQPLLDPVHPGALRQIEEERDVEHDRRSENAVAAQKIDLQLHRV